MSDTTIIETEALTKYYGDVCGVEDLSLSITKGEIFGFLGPNGAGKSTTIRALLGFLSPTSGSASLNGVDVTDRDALIEVKRNVGYLPDDASFYERITGNRILDYFASLKGDEKREELTERFPFPGDRNVKEYSRGNRQKLGIVQAFMHEPDLLIMDEPTSGLDPLLQQEFYDLIEEERDRGATIFFSSHLLNEVRLLCDRAAIIRDGVLVAEENIDELLRKSGKVVRFTVEETPPLDVFTFPGIAEAEREDGGYYRLILTDNYDALVDRLGAYSITDLEIRETSLEDVFMHFYNGERFEAEELEVGDV